MSLANTADLASIGEIKKPFGQLIMAIVAFAASASTGTPTAAASPTAALKS